ncbi:D-alanyl-D-alanine carboxypeptidase/D-alanyl-D-alanine-endopeptidase [Mariniphaga sediminis]|uniref:D-alanyl-D-alanine carboxypeptidase/D-alanyl-D-alanine-endopeptidase n=1 Tax=Mariniphaga sediminis TaxID=1628158 RepID=A0A399D0H2_9BACT|nr:D-alanyl-D-alanine carboxypeptidase/D-alanyl-D-alanine-endopeptidase [Mariniphaga sediminis]RIH65354.1 D-alanyl-D-alanine carboxypeptidase/D-alanyl-D-alanine-endopeptidase [Mariniphaga sediminis]
MKVRFFIVFSFLFLNGHLFAQSSFEKQVKAFLDRPEYRQASVGISVTDLATGDPVFERNDKKLFIPASVLKLVTSAAALEILGPDYRFQTRIGYTGTIKNGILKGDIVVIGGGDPALGSEYFQNDYFHPHFMETWAQRIKAAGIKRVEGNLVLDGSLYDTEKIPPTWIWEDMGNYYGAGTSALAVYDNLFRIVFRSPAEAGQPTEIISVNPKVEGMEWKNEVLSSVENRDLAYVFGSPHNGQRIVRGTIPRNRKSFSIKASNPFPEKLLADDFLHHLAREGVFITGKIRSETVEKSAFLQIYMTESPTLSEIVKVLNRESVNLFAEQLVKQVAAEKTGTGNRETGLKIITEFWKNRGLDTRQLLMEDGSGLSHFNVVSPAFLSSVLRYMENNSKNRDSFFKSLPTAGQGTLYHFSQQHFPEQALRIKSGSMTRIRCYSGYVRTSGGKHLSITIMVNHFTGSSVQLISEIEKLLIGLQKM